MWIFDRGGASALLLTATGRLFAPSGVQVGWLDGMAVFSLDAHQAGWFSDGLLRDLDGGVAGFTQAAMDAARPVLPEPKITTVVLSLPVGTARPLFPTPVVRVVDRAEWSTVDAGKLFQEKAGIPR
jgi:hypothetical protein